MKYVIGAAVIITIFILIKNRTITPKKIKIVSKAAPTTSSPMYNPDVNKIDHVFGNLYISNWMCSINEELLKKYNIKYVLCLNKENKKSAETLQMYQNLGISELYIEIDDRPEENIKQVFNTAYKFIESSLNPDGTPKGNVLVHCSMGVSRSATIVLMYLMSKMKNNDGSFINLQQAYALLKSKRPIINPNSGFLKALNEFENSQRDHTLQ